MHQRTLTVGLLVPSTRTRTAELLGLAPSVVGDQQRPVVLHERLLELVLGVLVDEFLVVGDDGFSDGLADGVDLRRVAASGDANADVDVGCCSIMLVLGFRVRIRVRGVEGGGESVGMYRICQCRGLGWARRL
jgi:hypothetical protein